jgi:hypothetical protein
MMIGRVRHRASSRRRNEKLKMFVRAIAVVGIMLAVLAVRVGVARMIGGTK